MGKLTNTHRSVTKYLVQQTQSDFRVTQNNDKILLKSRGNAIKPCGIFNSFINIKTKPHVKYLRKCETIIFDAKCQTHFFNENGDM